MNKLIGFITLGFIGLSGLSQEDPVIMEVNNEKVFKSDFEQIFWKNKKENVTNKEELDEYIDLYTKFRLKVEAAEEVGLDTTKKFKDEFAGYKIQLQKPYLVDTTVNDRLIKEAYDRTINELRASHILIGVQADASDSDTTAAWKNIMMVRDKITKGELTFEEAARKYSEDPSAKSNKGDLGFFSAFRMVYPFEDAAYKTEIGDISMPFRTQFGYHIVKPVEKRKSRGRVKVAHIMVRVKKDANATEKANAETKIYEIYEKLNAGEEFNELVRDFSDDRNSVRKNGELEWVEAGRYFKEFEDAAYSLKEDGEISKPVVTPAGWHILKRIKFKPIDKLTDVKTELKNKIQRDAQRSIKTKNSFLNNLKKEYAFVESKTNYKQLLLSIDNSIEKNEFSATGFGTMNQELFNYAGKSVTQRDFAEFLDRTQNFQRGMDIEGYVNTQYERFVSSELINFEKTQLERKYPQYKRLLQEYRDGILLFEINDQKIWSYAVQDTTGLKNFYEANKTDHMWSERADFRIFSSTNKKVAKQAYKLAKKGKLRNDSIVNYLNKDSQLNVSFESGRTEIENHEILGKLTWEDGLNKPVLIDNKYYVIAVDNILPAGPKELKQAKGAFIAAYQEYLEHQWISQLKEKYPVKVNYDVLYSIKNKP